MVGGRSRANGPPAGVSPVSAGEAGGGLTLVTPAIPSIARTRAWTIARRGLLECEKDVRALEQRAEVRRAWDSRPLRRLSSRPVRFSTAAGAAVAFLRAQTNCLMTDAYCVGRSHDPGLAATASSEADGVILGITPSERKRSNRCSPTRCYAVDSQHDQPWRSARMIPVTDKRSHPVSKHE
jgi:hypothetical protein